MNGRLFSSTAETGLHFIAVWRPFGTEAAGKEAFGKAEKRRITLPKACVPQPKA